MNGYFSTKPRLDLLAIVAGSWKGTPFVPNACVKSRGVSCQKLAAAIYRECGAVPSEFTVPDGPMKWSGAQNDGLIEKFMDGQRDLFTAVAWSAEMPLAGDMLGLRVGGCVHHCGVMLNDTQFIHCWRPTGTMISNIHDATFWTRIGRVWRPRPRN